MITRAAIGLMLFSLASSANAAVVLLKDYKAPKDNWAKAFNKVYLGGVAQGLVAFDAQLRIEGRQPLFCIPEKMALTDEQAENIMMREAQKMADPDRFPISIILIDGLEETFPCDKKH
jgi:Rap1a immunity proteins